MKRVIWSGPAKAELNGILEYIAGYSPTAALRTVRRIRAAIEPFRSFPNGGRLGEVPDTREIIVPGLPYIIVYTQRHGVMEIVTVRHGAQLYPPVVTASSSDDTP